MAEEMKISNLRLHVSFLEDTALLSDEEFGRLVRYGLRYIEGSADQLPPGPESLFVPRLVRMINEDNERYIRKCERQRENIMKRWGEKDTTVYDGIPTNTNDTNPKPKPKPKPNVLTDMERENGADAPTPSPKRHKHGAYGHVLLEDEQLRILQREFPEDWKDRIQRVDDYCESTGKTYKNYLQTIRNWARRDGKDIDPNTPSANGLVAATLRRKA